MKRSDDDLQLRLKPNKDIAAELGARKRPGQVLVGFALETNDEFSHACRKLEKKNLDFIVLNSLQDPGAGFRCDTNKVTIIERDGSKTDYAQKPKTEVALDIISHLVKYLKK